MLLWRWKNEHKKFIIWIHLVAGAFVLHIFLGLLFFSYCRHGVTHIVLTMKRNVRSIPVNFVPFQAQRQTATQTISAPAALAKKSVSQKKIESRKTSMAQTKPVKKAEIKKVIPPKKTANTKAIKKEEQKKIPEKKEIKKEVVKPAVQKETEKVPIIPETVAPAVAMESSSIVLAEEIAVSNEQAELYALVAKQWAPPVGIAQDKVCEVSAEIGWNYEVVKVWFSAKSGILMYDIAARKAVMQTEFPAWTRGKTITIRFVQ